MTSSSLTFGVIATILFLSGCSGRRQTPFEIIPDMDHQAKWRAQMENPFFADRRASRKPVEGTVAQGKLFDDDTYHLGVVDGKYIGRNPEKVTKELVVHGQRKFNTYCSPCHGQTGDGKGIVAQRSLWQVGNLQDPRVKEYPDGEIFSVASDGRRQMNGYRNQIGDRDRWAIVSYVRALQRASASTLTDVPADLQGSLH